MKLGFLYAGQGSQHPGMGADLYERFPTFRAVLDSAAARVDFDLKEVSFTDAKGVLNQTRYTWSWWPSVAKPWRMPPPDGPLPW